MKKSNRLIFTWIHLLVLLFPMAIKEVHFHSGETYTTQKHSGELIVQRYAADACAICDFEFLPFISSEALAVPSEPDYSVPSISFSSDVVLVGEAGIQRLRAPPVFS